jgi:ADP-ribosylglycohydrolase
MSWCFAGAPPAVRALLARSWQPTIEAKPLEDHKPFGLARPRPGRTVSDAKRLSRIQGCWLGQLTGDALGGLVEFRDADDIARQYPHGVRELRDGGTWNTFAGQPTDDSELALMLARCLVEQGTYDTAAVRQAYVHWANSHPFDMGFTTSSALRRNQLNHESQANGSLMRVSPLGIVGARHPELAMEWARTDSGLTHPHPVCRDTCAVFVAALAAAIRGAEAKECHALALREARESAVREALTAAESAPPDDFMSQQGWVLIALHNAFYQLLHAVNFEEGVVATVMSGGDTDTNAAIAGALLGACHGREAIPPGWRRAVMCCRPLVESGSQQPRPMEFWPVDALILAESLAVCVPKVDFQSPQTR